MSLKENISMVKQELSAEEQFFEQAVKTERFVKKYRKPLIAVAVAIGIAVAGTMGYDAYEASVRTEVNEAFAALQKDENDKAAQQLLQRKAPLLYDAWRLGVAVRAGDTATLRELSGSKAAEIADIGRYEYAAITKDAQALDGYAAGREAIYRDMALVDEAVLLLKDGKTAEAHRRLQMIGNTSPVYALATALMHYGVK